ncbi:MAG: hypothetical protein JNN28_21570 [Saprospiraceae bacterium]|nr:hypothetical protein [Saprospiraceae bacterium]
MANLRDKYVTFHLAWSASRLREATRIPSPTHAGAMFHRHAQYFRLLFRQHEAANFNLVREL